MGDGIYQVQPGDQVLFRKGTVGDATNQLPPDCGRPAPSAVQLGGAAAGPRPAPASAANPSSGSSVTAPLPPSSAADVQVTVDAPFVFPGR